MAEGQYVHGEMDINNQSATWSGFLTASTWGGFIIALILAYATMTIALGVNWFVSLVVTAGVGIVGGLLMGMGGAWLATVVALSGVALMIQLIITMFRAAG